MKFVIPTYQRADRVRTVGYLHDRCGIPFDDIILCVQDAADEAAYKRNFPECVVSLRAGKNAAMNRNNGLLYARSHWPGQDFVMLDDDFDYLLLLKKEGTRKTAVYGPLEGPEFLQTIEMFFDFARKAGATLWGITIVDNPFFMRRKIMRNALMAGGLLGFVNGGGDALMDETFYMKEDYEFLLRLLQQGKKTLKFCMLAPRTTMRAAGGCTESRKAHTEKEFADRLLARYEGLIVADPRRPGEIKMI